ncbi:MAG: gamma-glutamylcyclotransferase [Proteobacteria bacterium]|nr:gamma-glutamylcyclotransferase [Pseudomonadota bacterium]
MPDDHAGRDGGLLSEQVLITREALADGSLLARVRATALPDMKVLSDAEIEASLDATLRARSRLFGSEADRSGEVWVFGYGSLMWNPAFAFDDRHVGTIRGWHRRFCFWAPMGRGTPDNPGLMLALDRGGACRGIAFRIGAAEARRELLLVWRREMFGTAYLARWVRAQVGDRTVPAVTFVANRAGPRYVGRLDDAVAASHIATARGSLGTCRDYLDNTLEHLAELGIRDAGLARVAAQVRPL